MALSEQRLGEIAVRAWEHRLFKDGMMVNPKEAKRDIKNWADSLGITVPEAAEVWLKGLDYIVAKQRDVLQGLMKTS